MCDPTIAPLRDRGYALVFFDIEEDLIEEVELIKDSYILDIGCRRGKGVKYFLDKGYKNTYGIDIGD